MYYRVFWVNYESRMPKSDYRRSLFIATEESKIRRGYVYEAKGPRPAKDGSDHAEFYLYFSINKAPENSMHFHSIRHIGRIKDSNLNKVLDVCENIKQPVVPLHFQGESPNGCDWIDNVLYRLHRRGIVEFKEDFDVPSSEVSLVSKTVSSPEKGSSSKTDKGSSSKKNG